MQPAQFFSSANVLIVAGKGGVGKTVAAATIATAAAQADLNVLLVEVGGRSASAPMFGAEPQGYEEATVVHEAGPNGSGSITLRSITPDEALVEWLATHGFNRLVGRLASSGILEIVATATPGIKDLLILGRIKALVDEARFDLIVVDAPAAGHAIGFLRSPRGVRDVARTGVLHRQAVEVLDLIGDPERCQVMLVTIPEETPINELIETSFAVEDELDVRLGPVVVNQVLPTITGLDQSLPALELSAPELSADDRDALQTAAMFRSGRTNLQTEQLERLGELLPLPQIRLPQLFGTEIGPDEIDELAARLAQQIDALPEEAGA
ncbi:MAG: ArsA-related P-loop ATPase [Actinomycetota bacterium]